MMYGLVDLAALDGGGHTEGVADRFAERLRAIDEEQPGQRRIEPPGEEIVEQGLDDDSVLRRPLDHGQDMLVAVAIDADRRHKTWSPTCRPSIWMTSRSSSERSEASQAFIFFARQRHKAPGNGRLRGAVATRFRQVALGQTDRAVVLAGRHVQDHQVERPLEHRLPSRSTCQLSNPPPCQHGREPVAAALSRGRRGSRSRSAYGPSDNPDGSHGTMSGPAHGRGVLLHHLGQGLDPGPGDRTDPR